MTGGDEQLGLFGPVDPHGSEGRRGRGGRPVRPAEPDVETERLAARLPAGIRCGTSSWSFPGWRGLVWSADDPPPTAQRLAASGLAAYARHPLFRAVGIDRTFYAPVPLETWRGWADAVPESFRFLVKAPRDLTMPRIFGGGGPNPAFLDAPRLAREVLEPAAAVLGARLGVVVIQFPPMTFRRPEDPMRFLERLGPFLTEAAERARRAGEAAGTSPPPLAVEIRNRSLVDDAHAGRYREVLEAAGAAHAFCVHPSMPTVAEQAARLGTTGPGPLTVRWMLCPGETYASAKDRFEPFDALTAPDPVSRIEVASLARAAVERGAVIIVNNKAEGSAPRTIRALAEAMVDADAD